MKLIIFLLPIFSSLVFSNRQDKNCINKVEFESYIFSEESYEDSKVSSEEYESNVYDDLNIDPEETLEFLNNNDYVDNDDIHYEGKVLCIVLILCIK